MSSYNTGDYHKYHLTHDIISNKMSVYVLLKCKMVKKKKLKSLTFKFNDYNDTKIIKRIV